MKIKLPYLTNPELVANEIGDFIVTKALRIGTTGGVLGLSGGVDSTTVAALTKKAFDKYNSKNPDNKLELVGYMLPSNLNDKADEDDAVKVAKKLRIRYEVLPINKTMEGFYNTNPEIFNVENDFHKGNLMSRVRANILSTKGATEKKFVIGTGNKDEDFGIGYYTLFGDGAVHISPIGNLPKRLVREMATYLRFEDLANRTPTAGLEPGQTDFTDLGYGYDSVEIVIEGLTQGLRLEQLVNNQQVNEIIQPQLAKAGKFNTTKQAVEDILNRHNIALNKMQVIHPPSPELSLEYK